MASSSNSKPKRKRHRSKWSDGDYYSASSDKQKKLTALSSYIPRETSDWTMSELENLQINWNWIDPSSTKSIDEFFDMFSNINADLPPLDADLIKMMEYLNANLIFDTSVNELEQENHVKVREYLVENFLPKVDADSYEELRKTVGSSSRVLIHHIEAGRHDFQNDLKEILYDLLLTSRTLEEMRFTTMLEKFCRMCNLKGSIGLIEETMIKDVRVVAVPDLTFRISSNEMPDHADVIQIMTVAEIKVSTNDSLVDQKIHDTRQKPEAIDKQTLQTMDPSKIRGFSQHVGQLIIGLGNSCFKKNVLAFCSMRQRLQEKWAEKYRNNGMDNENTEINKLKREIKELKETSSSRRSSKETNTIGDIKRELDELKERISDKETRYERKDFRGGRGGRRGRRYDF